MDKKEIFKQKFIERAKEKYKDYNYDYSQVVYKSATDKVKIICPIHGEYEQTPAKFMEGRICPECRGLKRKTYYTTEIFIEKAKSIHPEYDYSETEYVEYNTKLKVICPEHGVFYITPGHLLGGEGCPKCRYIKSASNKRRSLTEVINEANKVHNGKYDYSLIKEYKNDCVKYPIICPEHGAFMQTFNNHIKGKQGCPECGKLQSGLNRRITSDEFIKRAKAVHKNKYHYINDYVTRDSKIAIECPIHGVFYQQAGNHLNGEGCPQCKLVTIADKQRLTTSEFINKAKSVHENRYDYSKVQYNNSNEKVEIICPKHGSFYQQPNNHLQGNGCPKCIISSKKENEVEGYLSSLIGTENVIKKDRIVLRGKELDFYLPKYKIGIEYDGLYWHSDAFREDNYHLNKTNECENKGIRLIHIFEDEWIQKKPIVKSMLANLVGCIENKIYARKCIIKEVSSSDAVTFLEENHIQGKCGSSVRLGLYYNDELVSLMTFGAPRFTKNNNGQKWELLRFCNKISTSVVGGASRLFKHFIDAYNPQEIISYADRRYSVGKLYEMLGFKLYNISRPNYYYVRGRERIYRYNLRKQVLVEKYGCPKDMTEREFCRQQNWFRLYDCGMLCFSWKNEN